MSDAFDPFADANPWETHPASQNETEEPPVATTAETTPVPENVTLSFKGGVGYDASLLVLRAGSIREMNEQLRKEATELKSLLEQAAKIQAFNTALNGGSKSSGGNGNATPKKFENGKVKPKDESPAVPGDTCTHGRKLVDKGKWAALFCQAPRKSDQCDPLWKQEDGSFKAND